MTGGTNREPGRDQHQATGAELHDQADRQQGRQRRQDRTPEATKPEARTKEQNGQNNNNHASRQQDRRRRGPAPRRRITRPPSSLPAISTTRPGNHPAAGEDRGEARHRIRRRQVEP